MKIRLTPIVVSVLIFNIAYAQSNEAAAEMYGLDNNAQIVQLGADNNANVYQGGNENIATQTQTGNENIVDLKQYFTWSEYSNSLPFSSG